MQHWLAHIGTIHTLQQGVTIAGRLGQAQHNIDVLAPFPQLLDASVMQYSNLGEHYIYIYTMQQLSHHCLHRQRVSLLCVFNRL